MTRYYRIEFSIVKHCLCTFINCFILVRLIVDPEPIPGALSTPLEYTLNYMLFHQVTLHTYSFTPRGNLVSPNQPPGKFFGGNQRTGINPGVHGDTMSVQTVT